MALLVLLHAVITLVRLGGYVPLLARAGHVLGRPRVRRLLGLATGVVLIGFEVMITVR
ncbi:MULTISPECIES: hypothetical protein [unclassified Streptomyces]|uniref:hypothetical protein n=1 Tax=unclassified Streptomyces TaxID=2593676 RepID=UPI003702B3CC